MNKGSFFGIAVRSAQDYMERVVNNSHMAIASMTERAEKLTTYERYGMLLIKELHGPDLKPYT